MQKLVIEGGHPLEGTLQVGGMKNSAVALLPAAILADDPVILEGLPNISDVHTLALLIEDIGGEVFWETDRKIHINPTKIKSMPLPNGRVKQLRASYYFMGAMLGKFKEAIIGLPGGCNLGPRPIDQHIKGFEALGAEVTNKQGSIHLRAKKLRGARIYLDVASVGATINIMLAAVKAEGQTIIENAAKEPDIIDLATLLTSMGAKIKGVGTDIIRIEGVKHLSSCQHMILPDRIEAGTFAILAAAQGRQILIDNVIPQHLEALLAKLREVGVDVQESDEQLLITPGKNLKSVNIKTLVYPGFPTDLQQPFTSLLTKTKGSGLITDTIYPGRLKHIDELRRMNANIKVEGRSVVVKGPTQLEGTKVRATDLRAGASLVIAGLMAQGVTELIGVEHIDRGYEDLLNKLTNVGAKIRREELTEIKT